jgi:hypothetical protein
MPSLIETLLLALVLVLVLALTSGCFFDAGSWMTEGWVKAEAVEDTLKLRFEVVAAVVEPPAVALLRICLSAGAST